MIEGETAGAVAYFLESARDNFSRFVPNVDDVFNVQKAIGVLNSDYWQRALSFTDVYNCMPQKRRDEWDKSIREYKCPDFEEETVRSTLGDLLSMRNQFLSERVDGIFRRLSGEHVTNSPMGFNQRMIMNYVFSSYGHADSSQCGAINDLRAVIAKFMGRDEPRWNSSNSALAHARNYSGQWQTWDGGALRVRAYKKGTCHLEVHPDMAWRLNCILANLYPMAIPSDQRKKPERRSNKDFKPLVRALPFAVLEILGSLKSDRRNPLVFNFDMYYRDKATKDIMKEVHRILEMIGGVRGGESVEFDYNPSDVIQEIARSGCIPDQKSHQFYPTPEALALEAIEMARIEPGSTCCEPSAGMGGIALHMPEDTVCVELSKLYCKVLAERGRTVINADFLEWSKTSGHFDYVVMNPPFADGRALLHLEAAAHITKKRITAILPASLHKKQLLPYWIGEWSEVKSNEFDGTGVSVAIYSAVRK
jgi:hypothetical protein